MLFVDSSHLLTSTAGAVGCREETGLAGCSLVPSMLAAKAGDGSVQQQLILSHGQAGHNHPMWLARGKHHPGT